MGLSTKGLVPILASELSGNFALIVDPPAGPEQYSLSMTELSKFANGEVIPGQGNMQPLPAGTAYGTPLNVNALGGSAVRFYLGSTDTITFTIATVRPMSTPYTRTLDGARMSNKDEPISGVDVFIISFTGTPGYRIL